MSTTKSQTRGRPVEYRLSEILAAINVLTETGVLVSAKSLSKLIEVSEARAEEILDLLMADRTAGTNPLVPLCDTGNENEYMRIESQLAPHIKPLRLTKDQTKDCINTLNALGIDEDNPLRNHIAKAFFSLEQPDEISTATNLEVTPLSKELSHNLEICAQAIAQAQRSKEEAVPSIEAPEITFVYRGTNDDKLERKRHVVPLHIHMKDAAWIVESFDLDARGARSFDASKIKDISLSSKKHVVPINLQESTDAESIEITCDNDVLPRVLTWSEARIVEEQETKTVVAVPYYRAEWLPRQVLALGKSVSYNDERLKKEVARIARENLARAKKQGL